MAITYTIFLNNKAYLESLEDWDQVVSISVLC